MFIFKAMLPQELREWFTTQKTHKTDVKHIGLLRIKRNPVRKGGVVYGIFHFIYKEVFV